MPTDKNMSYSDLTEKEKTLLDLYFTNKHLSNLLLSLLFIQGNTLFVPLRFKRYYHLKNNEPFYYKHGYYYLSDKCIELLKNIFSDRFNVKILESY